MDYNCRHFYMLSPVHVFLQGQCQELESKTSVSVMLWQSMKGNALYLASALSMDQCLSVYDAVKRTLQPNGSCSQGQ